METDFVIILASLGLIALMLVLVIINMRDVRKFKKLLNNDYHRGKKGHHRMV